MANPQLENGYIKIANEIAQALMRTNLSPYQSRVLWAIWRKTYGWNKKIDRLSNSQLVELTGIHKSHVSRALKELKERKIVTNSGNKIGFNKDYSGWRELPKQVTAKKVTNLGTKVTNRGNKLLPVQADTKEKKETIQRKEGDKVPQCPHQEIIFLYHELLPQLPGVKVWTEERKKNLRCRWREESKRQNLDWWEGFFRHVRGSKFLMGANGRKWQPNLEWLIKKSNFVKIIEGVYHGAS
jgi:phage replication O-like protein O